jgi:hypothetical protein
MFCQMQMRMDACHFSARVVQAPGAPFTSSQSPLNQDGEGILTALQACCLMHPPIVLHQPEIYPMGMKKIDAGRRVCYHAACGR